MKRVTRRDIEYNCPPYGHIGVIPKGASVIPAFNLPDEGKYWVDPWHGMTDKEESWASSYGFLVDEIDTHVVDIER